MLSEGKYEESLALTNALSPCGPPTLWRMCRRESRSFVGRLRLSGDRAPRTLRVDPSHFSKPQLFLADIYLRRGDRRAAAEALKDYLERRPDAPQTRNASGGASGRLSGRSRKQDSSSLAPVSLAGGITE